MVIKIERRELDHLAGKRVPFLFPGQPTQNGFQVAFIGVFEDQGRIRLHDALNFGEGGIELTEMMHDADHGRAIEKLVDKWESVDVEDRKSHV